MTREEAIRILNFGAWWDNLNPEISDAYSEPLYEALDMAIAALRAADGANAAARVKKPRAPKMTRDEMLQNLKSIAKTRKIV